MVRASFPTVIAPAEQGFLERLARGRNTAQKVVLRARIVLSHAGGLNKVTISQTLQTSRPTVDLWLQRFRHGGLEALLRDAPRPASAAFLAAGAAASRNQPPPRRIPRLDCHCRGTTRRARLPIPRDLSSCGRWARHGGCLIIRYREGN